MTDILLAHSYFLKYDAKQSQKMRPLSAAGDALCRRPAAQPGATTVALFDAMLADGEHEFAGALQRHRPRFVVFYEDNFNFLSKMCLSRMRDAACHMSELARASGATVIASGSDVSDRPELYFAHGVQFAMLGEPDHTLAELLAALRVQGRGSGSGASDRTLTSDPWTLIPGLALPDPAAPGGVYRTAKRPPERHPDVFPFPAWDLIDVERYRAGVDAGARLLSA